MDALDVVQVVMADVKMYAQFRVGRRARLHVHLTASVAQEIAILAVVIHV